MTAFSSAVVLTRESSESWLISTLFARVWDLQIVPKFKTASIVFLRN